MENDDLARYLDEDGRVTRWATNKNKPHKELIIAYLATKFEHGKQYHEREVNEILKQWHTFEDWAMLRRELFVRGYLGRLKDGSAYWREEKSS